MDKLGTPETLLAHVVALRALMTWLVKDAAARSEDPDAFRRALAEMPRAIRRQPILNGVMPEQDLADAAADVISTICRHALAERPGPQPTESGISPDPETQA